MGGNKTAIKRPKPSAVKLKLPRAKTVRDSIMLIPGYDPFRGADAYEFDTNAARYACAWIPGYIKHCKGRMAGKPFELLPWEKAVVSNLFGWKHKTTGHLRYREALLYVAKKNGKSAFAAALVLYLLHGWPEKEYGSEIYSAASTVRQAGHVYNHAVGMLMQSPELQKDLKHFGGHGGNQQKSIYYKENYSAYYCIAADSNSADGSNVSAAVIDELHRFHTSKHFEFCNVVEMSTAARDQSLVVYTTTADYMRESVCNSKRDYALKVRDGVIDDPQFLPVVYEVGHDEDWENQELWHKANPSLGHTVDLAFLQREYEKAKSVMSNRNQFMRLHLNMMTQADKAWIDMAFWNLMEGSFTEEDLEGQECYVGVDLASVKDLTAVVLLFPQKAGFRVLSYFWAPRDKAEEREKEDKVPYCTWADESHMELTSGEYTDYNVVEARIKELGKKFRIREIAFDPHNGQQLMNNLDNEGFQVFKFTQSYTNFAPAVMELERIMESKALEHNGNKVMNWCASNVCLEEQVTTQMRRPAKTEKGKKIDGMVSLLMALGRSMASERKPGSAYSKRGLFS